MAKKKNLGKFYTEGMTVQQIKNLGDDVIRNMSERDLSRAVRTLSLAANKRLARLERHAERTKSGIREKGPNLLGIDFNALQSNQTRFGVANARAKAKIVDGKPVGMQGLLKSEFTRVRNFLNAGSSTIEGAIELRKEKEIALYGKTREEMIQERIANNEIENSKTAIRKEYRRIDKQMKAVYENYNKWKEEYGMKGGYDVEEGKNILARFGAMAKAGVRKDSALKQIRAEYKEKYEKEEKAKRDAKKGRFNKVLDPERLKEQWGS